MRHQNKITQVHYLSSILYISSLFWFIAMMMLSKESYVFSVIVIIISLYIFIYYNIFYVGNIKKWKKTMGKYQNFTIEKIIYWDIRTSIGYRPHFSYEYTVNNNLYSNDRLSVLQEDYLMWTEKGATKLISKNQKENSLTVYYNPENPEDSMLIPGYSSTILFKLYLFLFFGITLLLRVMYELWF